MNEKVPFLKDLHPFYYLKIYYFCTKMIRGKSIISNIALAFIFASFITNIAAQYRAEVWTADMGNELYRNPIINAGYSDPDVSTVGDDYYMTAYSFQCVPGLNMLHSKDLVNWSIISYASATSNLRNSLPVLSIDVAFGHRAYAIMKENSTFIGATLIWEYTWSVLTKAIKKK